MEGEELEKFMIDEIGGFEGILYTKEGVAPDTGSVGMTVTPGGVGVAVEEETLGVAIFEDGVVIEDTARGVAYTVGVVLVAKGDGTDTEDIPDDEASATLEAGGG